MTMVPCLKRTVRCVILRDDGRRFEGHNLCAVAGRDACPRAGFPSGEGYELCDPLHAEVAAAALASLEPTGSPGTAFLYGHDYICRACQDALLTVNVRRFVIMPEGATP